MRSGRRRGRRGDSASASKSGSIRSDHRDAASCCGRDPSVPGEPPAGAADLIANVPKRNGFAALPGLPQSPRRGNATRRRLQPALRSAAQSIPLSGRLLLAGPGRASGEIGRAVALAADWQSRGQSASRCAGRVDEGRACCEAPGLDHRGTASPSTDHVATVRLQGTFAHGNVVTAAISSGVADRRSGMREATSLSASSRVLR